MKSSAATAPLVQYDPSLENLIAQVESLLTADYGLSKRSLALLIIQEDPEIWQLVFQKEPETTQGKIRRLLQSAGRGGERSPLYRIVTARQRLSEALCRQCVRQRAPTLPTLSQQISDLLINPLYGSIFLALLLYFAFYQFVGVFAAGTVVEFLEDTLFGEYLLPPIIRFFQWLIPWSILQDLFVGEYGLITLGVRYALALLLPIVTAFFLVFSLVEDSGYFPRLALLVDRLFKKIGLSGRAVIPMVLGFGCDTMATMVTRILETRRERMIAIFLLALAVPCSAQLGVLMATVSKIPFGIAIWAFFVSLMFLTVGFLSSRILPGEPPRFYLEVVPLRLPRLENVLAKTLSRLQWYLWEVTPLFLLASFLIWLGQLTHIFDLIIAVLSYPVAWIGLPSSLAPVILFGFFRRDYGAAGLLDMVEKGVIGGKDLVVTAIVLTLFVPCIANFLMMVREQGWKTGVLMTVLIFTLAFFTGWVASHLITWTRLIPA
ncbi:MAG: ferrous iron transporter B [Armatimonadetes bacterium]|nr:ferrous iron transporter B [Armatimonadota bacterium]MDW8122298.1 nucleoside recognition domain-containing protein [Armatimonadota bacterium]